jgi:23S rRNA pseudouridine1911/1915/1917 synthase
MPRFVVGSAPAADRLDKLLVELLPGTSRVTVQRWIGEGRVRVDGLSCRAKDTPKPGSTIDVEPGPEPVSLAEPDASVPFQVLFEDEHLIVVEKPAGVVVHPARGHRTGTLISGLLAREGFARPPADPRDPEGMLRPGMVQRLDKDTSGVLVVAKDVRAREGLKAQLSARSAERLYRALTLGVPRQGEIKSLYGRDPRSRLRFTTKLERGREAVTHVRVAEQLARGRAALVECRLATGRTHQIRVHLLERADTPILGDPLYGRRSPDPELERISAELGRQALHAAVLGFVHPLTGGALRFEAPLPADMQRALEQLRALG